LGGLMSYGPNFIAVQHRAADYVDKVLKGENPPQFHHFDRVVSPAKHRSDLGPARCRREAQDLGRSSEIRPVRGCC
jgi:hypothetical protein